MYEYLIKDGVRDEETGFLSIRTGKEFGFTGFWKCKPERITELEQFLGYTLPSELKQFYIEIGYGNLLIPKNPEPDYENSGSNQILAPIEIIQLYNNFEQDEDGYWWPRQDGKGYLMYHETFNDLKPNDLPVFEVANGSEYMIMKPLSDNPNAVYNNWQEKVEDSFATFIYRMYHEHPNYFCL